MPWVFTYNDWSAGTEYDRMVEVAVTSGIRTGRMKPFCLFGGATESPMYQWLRAHGVHIIRVGDHPGQAGKGRRHAERPAAAGAGPTAVPALQPSACGAALMPCLALLQHEPAWKEALIAEGRRFREHYTEVGQGMGGWQWRQWQGMRQGHLRQEGACLCCLQPELLPLHTHIHCCTPSSLSSLQHYSHLYGSDGALVGAFQRIDLPLLPDLSQYNYVLFTGGWVDAGGGGLTCVPCCGRQGTGSGNSTPARVAPAQCLRPNPTDCDVYFRKQIRLIDWGMPLPTALGLGWVPALPPAAVACHARLSCSGSFLSRAQGAAAAPILSPCRFENDDKFPYNDGVMLWHMPYMRKTNQAFVDWILAQKNGLYFLGARGWGLAVAHLMGRRWGGEDGGASCAAGGAFRGMLPAAKRRGGTAAHCPPPASRRVWACGPGRVQPVLREGGQGEAHG